MSMSKKDYEVVADALGKVYSAAVVTPPTNAALGVKYALEMLSDTFAQDNSRFQPETFRARFEKAVKDASRERVKKVMER